MFEISTIFIFGTYSYTEDPSYSDSVLLPTIML